MLKTLFGLMEKEGKEQKASENCGTYTFIIRTFHRVLFIRPPPPWRNCPQWARASSLSRLHDHTQIHSTLGRTPLYE